MKGKYLAAAAGVLVLILGVACGGGGGEDQVSEIRTQKGLVVAAASQNLGRSSETGGGASDDGAANPFAPPAAGLGGDMAGADREFSPFAPYPELALQQSNDGITVVGYGSATAAADTAIIEFYFGRSGDGEVKPDGTRSSDGSGSSGSSTGVEPAPDVAVQSGQVTPITEAELQPVIDALVGAGIAREEIEFIGQSYYDMYYASATIRATVTNLDAVEAAVGAVRDIAGSIPNVQLQSTNVSYTLDDCTALERAAMEAAVEDASARGQELASVLGVGLGDVTGASNYSYSPYGGTPCDGGYIGPYPLGGVAYAEGQASDVSVFVQVSVTYAIQ